MRRGGFTLVELLLVIAILGAVAVLVTAQLGAGLDSDRLASSSRVLAASLQQAADRARLVGRRHRVMFEPLARSYRIEEEDDPLDAPGEWTAVELSWARPVVLPGVLRFGVVLLDGDDTELARELTAAEWLAVEFDPEGVHRVSSELEIPVDGAGDAPLVEIPVELGEGARNEPETLTIRLEPNGRVLVWTQAEREAHRTALDEAMRR